MDTSRISVQEASEWLNSVHRGSRSEDLAFDGMDQLRTLRKSTLLDWENDGILQIHDLVREHADKEVRKSTESRWLCLEGPDDHERLAELSSEAWSKVERIALVGCGSESLAKMRWDRCSAVKALYVGDCSEVRELRLSGMRGLRSLEIYECGNLVKLEGLSRLDKLRRFRVQSCEGLFAEEELDKSLEWICEPFVSDLEFRPPHIGCLIALENLDIRGTGLRRSLDLSRWICEPFVSGLEFRPQRIECLIALENLDIKGTRLRRPLDLSRCTRLQELRLPYFPKLGNFTQLQTLQVRTPLRAFGSTMTEVPDLSALCSLRDFDLEGQHHLMSLPSLDVLTQLRSLRVAECEALKSFPDLSRLTHLQELFIKDCGEIEELPGVENLAKLEKLHLSKMCLWKFPELGSLTELRFLHIWYCQTRKMSSQRRPLEFPMASLGKLVNLTSILVCSCTVTREFLDLSEISRVERLRFESWNLKRVEGFSSALRSLYLNYCEALEAIPDLGNLPKLSNLLLGGCKKLALAVVDVQKLSTLDIVDVGDCVASVDAWMDICKTRAGSLFRSAVSGLLNKIREAQDAEEKHAIREAMAEEKHTIIQQIANSVVAANGYCHSEFEDALMILSWRQGQPDVVMADQIATCIGVETLTAALETDTSILVGVLAAVAATGKYWDDFLQHSVPTVVLRKWRNTFRFSRRQSCLYACAVDSMAQNSAIAAQLKQQGASDLLIQLSYQSNSAYFDQNKSKVWAAFVGEHRLGKEFAIQVLQDL